MARRKNFAYGPNGELRYLNVFDNGPECLDRFDVLFTRIRNGAWNITCFGDSGGTWYHLSTPRNTHPSLHLGKRISFEDLPKIAQETVREEYAEFWGPFEGGQS